MKQYVATRVRLYYLRTNLSNQVEDLLHRHVGSSGLTTFVKERKNLSCRTLFIIY